MPVRSTRLLFAAIVGLLLLAATAGCTGGGEPQDTPTAIVNTPPAFGTTIPPALGTNSTPYDISWLLLQVGPREERFGEGVYQVAFSPRERPLIFELPGGRSYRATFTGIMLGSPVLACDGLLLAESNSTAGLCLDVDRAVELDRRSWSTGQAAR